MLTFKAVSLATIFLSFISIAYADNTFPDIRPRIISGKLSRSRGIVRLEIESAQYCNNPKYSLEYKFSGRSGLRSIFGPHMYDLIETPENKLRCFGTEAYKINLPIEYVTHLPSYGERPSRTEIYGKENSKFEFWYPYKPSYKP